MKKHSIISLVSLYFCITLAPLPADGILKAPDFRNSNWGDTKEEVIKSEGRIPDHDSYEGFAYDLDTNPYFDEVTFYFNENNTLYSASYSIPADRKISYSFDSGKYESSIDEFQKTANEERIDLIRERFTAKYGERKTELLVEILKNTDSDLFSLPSIVMAWDATYTYWVTEYTVIMFYFDDDFDDYPYLYYLSRNSQKASERSVEVYLDALI